MNKLTFPAICNKCGFNTMDADEAVQHANKHRDNPVETIIKDVISRHQGNSFHDNRVKADLEEALRLLNEAKK